MLALMRRLRPPRPGRPAPWLLLAPGLVLALAGARADDLDSLSTGTQEFGEVGTERPSALDSVGQKPPTSLRGVERQPPEELEVQGSTDELNWFRDDDVQNIEQVNEEAGPWQPPACDLALAPADEAPQTDDPAVWKVILEEARVQVEDARRDMLRAEAGFTQVNTDPSENAKAPEYRAALAEARDEFARARCTLLGLLEAARRAGVPPGTLREVRQQLPAGLEADRLQY